ncbi:uncharacterized protein N7479_005783 [Penicillium vulpinum]|uniref:Uncharacterized protein n=1 Tax=Penicillium vulpinum TaxID=29845 RepID=A0A1V6SEI7_9EURO|nr:uncharacterized protein N7479_005783 [Penicillium vulpinum]KAJ5958633.1 hypothetical protein N7479_005783 [Penicillium vulpinum]OQE12401.1 hypothetical protein PENVUL_c001G03412 [Penicillium vulpinum]
MPTNISTPVIKIANEGGPRYLLRAKSAQVGRRAVSRAVARRRREQFAYQSTPTSTNGSGVLLPWLSLLRSVPMTVGVSWWLIYHRRLRHHHCANGAVGQWVKRERTAEGRQEILGQDYLLMPTKLSSCEPSARLLDRVEMLGRLSLGDGIWSGTSWMSI